MSEARLEDGATAQFEIRPAAPHDRGCPVSHVGAKFTPFGGAFVEDPYPVYQQFLAEEPVFYCPEIDYWVVSRYDDVKAVFQDPATWSAAITLSAVTAMSQRAIQRLRESGFRMNPVLTNLDPPAHARIRRHATNAFSTRHVAEAEPWIRGLANQFIDRLLARAPGPDGLRRADMVSEFAYDLPAHVGMRFVGIPDDRVPDVKAWTANRVRLTWGRCTEEEQWREVEGLIAMWKFCESHVEAMMDHDTDSFLGDLVRFHRENPADLTLNEIQSMLFTMIVAGHETTSNVLASSLQTLLSERRLWERLVQEPSLAGQAVEEMLRYRPSVTSWRRIATRDVQLAGHDLPKGSRVLLLLAAANHDPSHFPDPETFDLLRPNARKHMAFGHGVHLCVGAGLARLELRVFLEQLIARMPDMKIDPHQAFHYAPSLSFRGPSHVRVHW